MSITVAALELIPETSAAEQLVADAYAIDARCGTRGAVNEAVMRGNVALASHVR